MKDPDAPSMLEQILDALLHPRLLMTAVALLSLYAGVLTAVFDGAFLHWPVVWSTLGIVGGVAGLTAVVRPTRWTVSVSGAILVVVAISRGAALLESTLTVEYPTAAASASQAISSAAWLTVGYITWALWRRQVVPWSVMQQRERARHV